MPTTTPALPLIRTSNYQRQRRMCAGDLCSLSWNDSQLGHGLIVGFQPDFIWTWPVTNGEDVWHGAAKLPGENDLWTWPSMETGISRSTIDGFAGKITDLKWIREIHRTAARGASEPPFCRKPLDWECDDRMRALWRTYAHMGETWMLRPLNAAQLIQHAGSTDIQEVLGVDDESMSALIDGRNIPTMKQVEALRNAFPDIPPLAENMLPEAKRINEPDFKPLVVELMDRLHVDEIEARRVAVNTALESRYEGTPGERMRRAFDELLGK